MSRLASRRLIRLATLLGALALPAAAHAQASAGDKAAAEALFDRGLSLMRDNKFQEACQTLEQSQAIERGVGTMLYLAECYEKLGRTASAWALFREAASEARAEGQSARADAGASRAQVLESKLSRLTVQVDPANLVPGFELMRDGQPVARGLYGVPLPVDPGEHRLEARAPGRLTWTGLQRVGPDGDTATVNVPALADDPNAAAAPTETGALAATTTAGTAGEEAPPPRAAQRTVGLVIGGAGVLAVGIGGFFGLRAMSKNDDAKEHCSSDTCRDQTGVELTADAQDAANLANVFVIGGAMLATTGAVLYLTAPAPGAPAATIASDGRSLRFSVGGAF